MLLLQNAAQDQLDSIAGVHAGFNAHLVKPVELPDLEAFLSILLF